MDFIQQVIFFLICIVAVYPLVTAQAANGPAMMARMKPFEGAVGIISFVLGLIGFARSLGVLGVMLTYPVGIMLVLLWAIEIVLGLILAWPLISKWLSKEDGYPARVSPLQVPLGILGIAVFAMLLVL